MRVSDTCNERVMSRRAALRLMRASVVGLGLSALFPTMALADPDDASSDSLSTQGIASAETESALEDALRRYEEARSQLDAIGKELEALTFQLDETEGKIGVIQANIAETTRHIKEKDEELDAARTILADRMVATYKSGGTSMLDVVLSSSSMDELVTGVYYYDKVAERDRKAIDDVRRLKAVLERQEAALENRRARLDALREQQVSQKQEIENKHREAQSLLDALDIEVKELVARRQEEVLAAAEAERQASELLASNIAGESAELRANVVNAALKLLGVPYVYGGTYPESGGTDCSGLVQWAFAQCGVRVPRTTYTQAAACRAIGNYFDDPALLLPGDLVFCNKGGHVALYIGDGRCIHEPMPGDVCSIVPITRWSGGFIVGYGFPLPSASAQRGATTPVE